MDNNLQKVRKVYDLTVVQFRNGIDPYANIPDEIKNSAFYKSLQSESVFLNSSATDVKEYLAPSIGMNFLDAGCSANLVNYRLDKWPSTYYGVDISPALIEAMKGFVEREKLAVGGLEVAEISNLPFTDSFFDIASVIGVLEYCPFEYVRKSLKELNRVLKPGTKAVMDIPNPTHPYVSDMQKLEECLQRPIFIHPREIFEKILAKYFSNERTDDNRVMIRYFVRATE